MYFTPTIFIAQLLAAMQVLMTLNMPLSTTMALPVTSKPIESTVENLAWQAWIELPPEQKQQVKSRKVTPKSIFTLPLRVECPEGHKQVDTKCIPIVIGSNDVLIDLNALGLLVGNTQPDDIYDYDDMGEEMGSHLPYGSDMPQVEAEKSVDGITVELKPPSKDEPLKFNIFQNKFNIFHEEPMEDYSALSNEGLQSSEKEQNTTESNTLLKNDTLSSLVANATAISDLLGEASNISEHNFEIYVKNENNSSERPTLSTLANDEEFKIDAISLPASGFNKQTSNTLAVIQNDSSIQLVTSIMDTEDNSNNKEENDKPQENDIQKLLQTESFLPTTTTLKDQDKLVNSVSLSTVADSEPSESSPETLNLNVDDDEMTTLPNVMEGELKEMKEKQEYTRSVTMNPLMDHASDSNDVTDNDNNSDNNDQVNDTTLENETNDEPIENTTPIQLDDTTVIETSSSLSSTPAIQQELKELLMQQEQAQKDFEELQRMRKGQKDQNKQQEQQQQHIVSKKSKVEPVEVLFTVETETTDKNMPTETTKSENELLLTSTTTAAAITAAVETVTPLLTVHNENDNNNDRFYYQHFAKQDLDLEQKTQSASSAAELSPTQTTATKITEIETIPLTSEIDLAEELRLINEMVKGIKPATTLTTIKTMQTSSTTTKTTTSSTTTTTEKPSTNTLKTQEFQSSSDKNTAISESFSLATKPTPSTLQIWSKIMPLLTTSTTATPRKTTPDSSSDISNDIQNIASTTLSSISTRSNRNSKIIRLNGFNSISSGKKVGTPIVASTMKTTTTTTSTEEDSSTTTTNNSSTISSSSSSDLESSSTENNTYEPYWWLPVAWRLDKPTSTEKHKEAEKEVKSEEQPLLLRFWSAYHAPKSS
ncbi:folded gastrulation isoform 1-T7 [Cochliomyia hominivorax]